MIKSSNKIVDAIMLIYFILIGLMWCERVSTFCSLVAIEKHYGTCPKSEFHPYYR